MSSLRTTYEFTLPRGYVDDEGTLHRKGVMRLATARDELAPLRDPTVQGPDDPRLTILVLTRVVTRLGSLEQINSYVIEGLFAVDLAFLQDFYGVINFGNQEEFDALIAAQESSALVGSSAPAPSPAPAAAPAAEGAGPGPADDATAPPAPAGPTGVSEQVSERPSLRHSVEELPRRSS
ncbi:hypothetical protein [Nocardioides dongxiaopingii]|uniref:hypothetical protein n=1 Tax=Nocardioides dongxiaopingii TaxID=2576036 RepID=UPI001BB00DF3|nr:hypothetical protein [Nocardioides dongxiaopingii]